MFLALLFLMLQVLEARAGYSLIRDWSGQSFFNGWDFYGSWDNLTLGNTTWVDKDRAFSQRLAYVNDAGNAVLRVDNFTDVAVGDMRDSIRITTTDFWATGTVWLIDILHLPWGCSVWPAFWSFGANWPAGGEIDVVEYINLMLSNQMALHTSPNISTCTHGYFIPPEFQTGKTSTFNDCRDGSGCTVAETKSASAGKDFNGVGGGIWATQFEDTGVYIWYWPRSQIPVSLSSSPPSVVNLTDWGPPSANYGMPGCDIAQHFTPQQLVLNIALCGDWAGVPNIYASTGCPLTPNSSCYLSAVVGPGSPRFDEAFFEISYVRIYASDTSANATITTVTSDTPASSNSSMPVIGATGKSGYSVRRSTIGWHLLATIVGLMTPFV